MHKAIVGVLSVGTPEVLKSGAGWYIGTSRFGEPESRLSGYYPRESAALLAATRGFTLRQAPENASIISRLLQQRLLLPL